MAMNIAEIKLNLFRNIDDLPEKLLLELRALIDDFFWQKNIRRLQHLPNSESPGSLAV